MSHPQVVLDVQVTVRDGQVSRLMAEGNRRGVPRSIRLVLSVAFIALGTTLLLAGSYAGVAVFAVLLLENTIATDRYVTLASRARHLVATLNGR